MKRPLTRGAFFTRHSETSSQTGRGNPSSCSAKHCVAVGDRDADCHVAPLLAMTRYFVAARQSATPPIKSVKKYRKGIYICIRIVYDRQEQSRRPRVKCCQNGELSGRRRTLSAMRYPHPLRHIGVFLYVATILGRVKAADFVLPFSLWVK